MKLTAANPNLSPVTRDSLQVEVGDPNVYQIEGESDRVDGHGPDASGDAGAESTEELIALRAEVQRLTETLEKRSKELRGVRGELDEANKVKTALEARINGAGSSKMGMGMMKSFGSKKHLNPKESNDKDKSEMDTGEVGASEGIDSVGPDGGSKACTIC